MTGGLRPITGRSRALPLPERDTRLPLGLGLLLFTLVSFLGNALAESLRYPVLGSAVFFVPYAALTAVLVYSRRKEWMWYLLVAIVTHAWAHWGGWPPSWILAADVANIARALVATVMLGRFFRGPPTLDNMRDLLLFVVAAVLVGPAVGASIGGANVVFHDASSSYWLAWQQWFMSNALTGLIILPLFLGGIRTTLSRDRTPLDWRQLAEALLLSSALTATCIVAFLRPGLAHWERALPLYAPLPVLIWAALRFGPTGVSLAVTAVAFAAIWSADRGLGPFLVSSPDDNILVLQVFLLLTALPILCMVIVNNGRRRALRLFRSLLASLEDQVAVLDARGRVLEVNESWRRFLRSAPADEFTRVGLGEDFLAVCEAAADRGNAAARRALAGVGSVLKRERRRFEMEYDEEPQDQHQWYTLTIEALARADGGAVVIRADVSSSRRTQMEVEEQRRELSHLARVAMLGELSGALAHELRQPLTSIMSNAQAAKLLLRREPPDVAEMAAILEEIQAEDRRAATVIERLRALLRRGETRLQAVDSGDLLREVLELCRMELLSRQVFATTLVEPDLPPVLADRVQLQQVLLNLVLNGCDAMSSTPPAQRKLVLAAKSAGAHHVDLSVRDCGTGIAPALVDRMFDPFVTSKPQGLGLGLSISRTIVSAHGGRLWAQNNQDRGATVHCRLVASFARESATETVEAGPNTAT